MSEPHVATGRDEDHTATLPMTMPAMEPTLSLSLFPLLEPDTSTIVTELDVQPSRPGAL